MRYRLRTLLVVLALGPPVLGLVLLEAIRLKRAVESASPSPLVSPQFLNANGFLQESDGIYRLGPLPIGDAAEELGFSLDAMRPTPGQSLFQDTRTVRIRNLDFVIDSLEKDESGRIIKGSLDKPESLATISVSLFQVPFSKQQKVPEVGQRDAGWDAVDHLNTFHTDPP